MGVDGQSHALSPSHQGKSPSTSRTEGCNGPQGGFRRVRRINYLFPRPGFEHGDVDPVASRILYLFIVFYSVFVCHEKRPLNEEKRIK